jgi:N-acetylglucosamine malate deacetylase 2
MCPEEILRRATAPEGSQEPMPQALLVFAHADDETAAVGARLRRFRHAYFVHVTDGAPRDECDSRAHGFSNWMEYRDTRARELDAVFATAGIPPSNRENLGIPDQEGCRHLADLTRKIERLLHAKRPEVIFTHPYEYGHPDHDACAFAVHHGVALAKGNANLAPVIIETPFYHAVKEGMATDRFLFRPGWEELTYVLSEEECRRKQRLFDYFVSQKQTLQYFKIEREIFRIAPIYDFGEPPHSGAALYDRFPWGIKSEEFRHLAAEAEKKLRRKCDLGS